MALGGLGNTTAMMLLDLRRGTPALRTVTPGIWSLLRVEGLVAGVPGQLWGRARRTWPLLRAVAWSLAGTAISLVVLYLVMRGLDWILSLPPDNGISQDIY